MARQVEDVRSFDKLFIADVMLSLASSFVAFNSPSVFVPTPTLAAVSMVEPVASDLINSRESLSAINTAQLVGKVVPTNAKQSSQAMERAFIYESRDSMGNAIGTSFTSAAGPAGDVVPPVELSGKLCYDRNAASSLALGASLVDPTMSSIATDAPALPAVKLGAGVSSTEMSGTFCYDRSTRSSLALGASLVDPSA